jgi:hypothetical protein
MTWRAGLILAALAGTLPATADTLGPGSQVVLTFTLKPFGGDILRIVDMEQPVFTGSPSLTVALYDGQTLLGTLSSSSPSGHGYTLDAPFVSATSTAAFPVKTVIPFNAVNTGTLNGRLVITVTGGSIANFDVAALVIDLQTSAGPAEIDLGFTGSVTGVSLQQPLTVTLPHFVYGGGFVTGLYVVNQNDQPATFTAAFYDDAGKPAAVPVNGAAPASTLTGTLAARGSAYYEVGTYAGSLVEGSFTTSGSASLTAQALMRRLGSDGSYYEAAIEASPGYKEFAIPFDQTRFTPTGDSIYTGFAIANLNATLAATVTCTARDSTGRIVPNAVVVPPIGPLGHWANVSFPLLSGTRGTLDCSSTTTVAALAVRAIGTNAVSALPVVPIR